MAFATIGTTGIADDAVTSAKVAPGVVDTEAQPNQAPIIINGNMAVAQRSTSVTGITGNGVTTVDRMYLLCMDILSLLVRTDQMEISPIIPAITSKMEYSKQATCEDTSHKFMFVQKYPPIVKMTVKPTHPSIV